MSRAVEPTGLIDKTIWAQRLLLDGVTHSPPSDRDIVERALLLTITQPTSREVDMAHEFWFGSDSTSKPMPLLLEQRQSKKVLPAPGREHLSQSELDERHKKLWQRFAQRWWETIEPQRIWFREAVRSVVDDTRAARRRLRRDIDAAVEGMLALPRVTWDGRKASTDLFLFCPTIEISMGFALMKMLDDSSDISLALRTCKFASCGRIFLSFPPPSGGPRPSYCDPQHRETVAKLSGAERTQRWRDRKAKGSK